jgi:hypothetical protein
MTNRTTPTHRVVLAVFDFDNQGDDDFLGQIEMEARDIIKVSPQCPLGSLLCHVTARNPAPAFRHAFRVEATESVSQASAAFLLKRLREILPRSAQKEAGTSLSLLRGTSSF